MPLFFSKHKENENEFDYSFMIPSLAPSSNFLNFKNSFFFICSEILIIITFFFLVLTVLGILHITILIIKSCPSYLSHRYFHLYLFPPIFHQLVYLQGHVLLLWYNLLFHLSVHLVCYLSLLHHFKNNFSWELHLSLYELLVSASFINVSLIFHWKVSENS